MIKTSYDVYYKSYDGFEIEITECSHENEYCKLRRSSCSLTIKNTTWDIRCQITFETVYEAYRFAINLIDKIESED